MESTEIASVDISFNPWDMGQQNVQPEQDDEPIAEVVVPEDETENELDNPKPEDTPVEGEVEESLAMLHALELERNGEADVYEFFINEDEEIDGEY